MDNERMVKKGTENKSKSAQISAGPPERGNSPIAKRMRSTSVWVAQA